MSKYKRAKAEPVVVGDRVETYGLSEEDSDSGIVLDVTPDGVRIGWDSLVQTTESLERIGDDILIMPRADRQS